ncbi:MAG: potassium transporter Kup [Lautropia sp.]|nr:MAG: potassium transporter Kup [Pseudomonadota bacterium]MBC6958225.1 potassium transporter Kup [Lautropia sp.]MCL4700780.1 KUP/HAK/KT family potassium transporter [Burkholderiaceae bacterium]MDL1906747.1 potassium transporter Kup [Betaproteobacteria bacterium PRO1]RIK89806.1 MAG: potassium transporter Kup [Burkholderiales bacterium]
MSASERPGRPAVTLAALGVVYGDIGTSPLYAFKEAFGGTHSLPLTTGNVFAVLSMIFWAVTIVVSLKYVSIMLRFDNRGDGGVLALLSYCAQQVRERPRLLWLVTILGAFAVSLFYGDAVITPAISVLSAVEGIVVLAPGLQVLVVPIALGIILALFVLQRRGTAAVGAFFGPVMLAWFLVLAGLGISGIVQNPAVLQALDPRHALALIVEQPGLAFVAASAVFLCMTGAEALYADMGHFGRRPVQRAWFALVLPSLTLNYFGQGALVLRDAGAARNPFYMLAPEPLLLPLIALATAATVIASQATISGAFSATQQASRLNFLPRLRVLHTSDVAQGQVYIPAVNWLLLVFVLALVLGFRSSGALASAYGIAVSGDLLITSLMMLIVLPLAIDARLRWLWPLFLLFAALEASFFAANAAKLLHGGWFPIVLALAVFTVLTTWRRGIEIMRARKEAAPNAVRDGLSLDLAEVPRVPGAAVFFSSSAGGCPSAFLHNLKHNRIVHEQTVFLTVQFDEAPRVPDDERIEVMRGANGIVRITAHFGYREQPDVDRVLRLAARKGVACPVGQTSFFTSKPTLVSVSRRGLFGWRRSLFGWMLQNSTSVANYFELPPDRVVELGTQVAI